jgi:hypothetical protein
MTGLSSSALANCSNPTAAEGSLNYDYTNHVYTYCNNTSTWIAIAASGGNGYADHIISGTTNVYANSATSTISFTTNGSVANYFDASGRLITTGISVTTNQMSATTGYFAGNVGVGTTAPTAIFGDAKIMAVGDGAAASIGVASFGQGAGFWAG